MKERDQIEAWKKEAQESLDAINNSLDSTIDEMVSYKSYDKAKAYYKITGQPFREAKVSNLIWKVSAVASIAASFLIVFYVFQTKNKNHFVEQKYFGNEVTKEIVLVDQSKVYLDNASYLVSKNERVVSLEGKAFFDITTTQDKSNFEIEIENGKVTVLGTKFSVENSQSKKEVAVEEGKVRFKYKDKEVIITDNQKATVNNDKIIIEKASPNQFSWKSKKLIFKDTPLLDAINDIEERYKVDIILKSNVKFSKKCVITSKFEEESIDEVMSELSTIFNITYSRKGSSIVILSGNC